MVALLGYHKRVGRKPQHSFTTDFFSGSFSEKHYWVLGWFYSDGCNAGSEASLSVHTRDKEVLAKVATVMRCGPPTPCGKQQAHRLRICSRVLCDRLAELGCGPRKSLVIRYPDCVSTREQHRHFLRCVFEGDGSLYHTGSRLSCKAEIASGSLDFLLALQRVIKDCTGLSSTVGYTNGLPRKLKIDGCYQQSLDFVSFLYEGANPALVMERKYAKWRELCARVANPPAKRTWNVNSTRRRAFYLKAPDGRVHHSDMVKPFALKWGLGVSNLARVARGDKSFDSIKRWTRPTVAEIEMAIQQGTLVSEVYAR